jgi:addiction module HigA family antidote
MRTTTEKPVMRMHNPPHPGRILQELWLAPLDVTLTEAAQALGISRKTLSKIVNGHGSLTPEMAVRLSITFGNTPEMWLRLQNAHDLWQVEHRRRRVNARPIAA